MKHTCHAHGCTTPVPPKMFMCKPHWYTLPQRLRDAIWREYRPGQERDKRPSTRYMAVQQLAIAHVVARSGNEQATNLARHFIGNAIEWRDIAIAEGAGDPLAGLIPPPKAPKGATP